MNVYYRGRVESCPSVLTIRHIQPACQHTCEICGLIVEARGEVYVPISPEGEAIKQAVREPTQNRNPVGYNRAFLDEYRSNETFYLSTEKRQRLLKMGARLIVSAWLDLMCERYSAVC